ncbi:hypothetical protein CEN39_23360 [Fischerella thermalis CCMEE 5201]|nr:hypothetical protein CEN39_23360 [Fischerella thermalis CCMEE 5201]
MSGYEFASKPLAAQYQARLEEKNPLIVRQENLKAIERQKYKLYLINVFLYGVRTNTSSPPNKL